MKQKKIKNGLTTFKEVDETIACIAVMRLMADNKENQMNQQILKIKTNFETNIIELRDKADKLEKDVKAFCISRKKEFATNRSKEMTYGRIGFRLGKGALKLLNSRTFTWDRVKEKAESLFGLKYIRKVETLLDKAKIIQDADNGGLTPEQIQALGCKVEKSDNFFLDIDYTKVKMETEK